MYVDCKKFSEPHINELLFENSSGGKYYSDYLNEKFRGLVFLDNLTNMSLETQSMLVERLDNLYKNLNNKRFQIISTGINSIQDALQEFSLIPTLAKYLCEETITLTPLNNRREDILLLFDFFQHSFTNKYHLQQKELSKNFEYLLTTYDWPQNIEQLKKVVKKFCFFGEQIPAKKHSGCR